MYLPRLLFALLIALCGCEGGGRSGLGPGEPPPDFTLDTLDGTQISLSGLKGKAVLLNFWATWCAPCIAEMPELEALSNTMKDRGLVVLGIAVDDEEEEVQEFYKRSGVSFPLAIDKTGKVKRAYRLSGVPETFVIGRDGKLVLVPDPNDGSPTIRMKGPRRWGGSASQSLFSVLLATPQENAQ